MPPTGNTEWGVESVQGHGDSSHKTTGPQQVPEAPAGTGRDSGRTSLDRPHTALAGQRSRVGDVWVLPRCPTFHDPVLQMTHWGPRKLEEPPFPLSGSSQEARSIRTPGVGPGTSTHSFSAAPTSPWFLGGSGLLGVCAGPMGESGP